MLWLPATRTWFLRVAISATRISCKTLSCMVTGCSSQFGRWCWRVMFFFFQAEDGIRDYKVTGVQTCALPIWAPMRPTGVDRFLAEARAIVLVIDPEAGALPDPSLFAMCSG